LQVPLGVDRVGNPVIIDEWLGIGKEQPIMHYQTIFTWKTKEAANRFAGLMHRGLENGDIFDDPAPECIKLEVKEVAEDAE
jgi:hypothetical protein